MRPESLQAIKASEIRSDGLDTNRYVNANDVGEVLKHLLEELWVLKDDCKSPFDKKRVIELVQEWIPKMEELERC